MFLGLKVQFFKFLLDDVENKIKCLVFFFSKLFVMQRFFILERYVNLKLLYLYCYYWCCSNLI